ncbi:hypothetical protein [Pleionea sp. CnH1-48]|uniref:hypothetical protein n=1 Tax=Pleionea sp. CnH1-48 TaxID=2954494 RepID=UPI002097420E|nr:hypothetical protein [Pleionea sp. CnH1-48]MCO7224855.1 hypothetical protein [Pleionea sp. CnH1-48]
MATQVLTPEHEYLVSELSVQDFLAVINQQKQDCSSNHSQWYSYLEQKANEVFKADTTIDVYNF